MKYYQTFPMILMLFSVACGSSSGQDEIYEDCTFVGIGCDPAISTEVLQYGQVKQVICEKVAECGLADCKVIGEAHVEDELGLAPELEGTINLNEIEEKIKSGLIVVNEEFIESCQLSIQQETCPTDFEFTNLETLIPGCGNDGSDPLLSYNPIEKN